VFVRPWRNLCKRESKKLSALLFFQFIYTKVGVEQVRHFFYIVSFLFDALGPAVHKLAYSFHEEGFRLIAQPFMHRFPPRHLVRIAGFRLLASKSL
jgi:hypothetical protein